MFSGKPIMGDSLGWCIEISCELVSCDFIDHKPQRGEMLAVRRCGRKELYGEKAPAGRYVGSKE
jgi:hypothetical protein